MHLLQEKNAEIFREDSKIQKLHTDPSFILLAKKNKAAIQPITVLWTTDKKQKIIVNFGESILPEKLSAEEAMKLFLETQTRCLRENEEVMARLN